MFGIKKTKGKCNWSIASLQRNVELHDTQSLSITIEIKNENELFYRLTSSHTDIHAHPKL